eukprot:2373198-Pleurochrysis_carterae.AAC.1
MHWGLHARKRSFYLGFHSSLLLEDNFADKELFRSYDSRLLEERMRSSNARRAEMKAADESAGKSSSAPTVLRCTTKLQLEIAVRQAKADHDSAAARLHYKRLKGSCRTMLGLSNDAIRKNLVSFLKEKSISIAWREGRRACEQNGPVSSYYKRCEIQFFVWLASFAREGDLGEEPRQRR